MEIAKIPDILRIGLCQMHVTIDKQANLRKAEQLAAQAAAEGADLVLLPEMFQCPYENPLVGGSIPERCEGKLYNTSYVFGPDGQLLGRHRKVHLFDVDVPGGIVFRESDTLTAGEKLTGIDRRQIGQVRNQLPIMKEFLQQDSE